MTPTYDQIHGAVRTLEWFGWENEGERRINELARLAERARGVNPAFVNSITVTHQLWVYEGRVMVGLTWEGWEGDGEKIVDLEDILIDSRWEQTVQQLEKVCRDRELMEAQAAAKDQQRRLDAERAEYERLKAKFG